MRTILLALAGIAACSIGALGGMATHPILKPPALPDWRERYRAMTSAMTEPAEPPVYTLPMGDYAYDLAAAGLRGRGDVILPPGAMVEPMLARLDRLIEEARPVEHAPADDLEGPAAVAHALEQTGGIGEAAPAGAADADADADAGRAKLPDLPQNGVGNPGAAD